MNKLIKRPEGRPTKYVPEVIFPKIGEYLASVNLNELPSVDGLAIYLDVTTSTIYLWAKEHEELSDYLKKIADKQRTQLMNDGMYGGKEVNSSMAIFLLKAIHGLKDNEGQVNVQVNVTPILSELKAE